jgi:hypothetical protein
MDMPVDFEDRLNRLDTTLFAVVPTQSSEGDRRAWLAVQRSIRANGYSYLETGSYLGGSIQQHLVDPLCRHVISIDKRPLFQPDERDEVIQYTEASTERMMQFLRKVDPVAVSRVTTFETDASSIDPVRIPEPPKFCFLDGEHTCAAAISDFEFCLKVCDPDAAICFHDARIIHSGLVDILHSLKSRNVQFVARRLGGDSFGIFLRNCPAATDKYILENSSDPEPFFRKMRLRTIAKNLVPKSAHEFFKKLIPAP